LITGARQAGKTTLMEALQQDLVRAGKPTLWLSLDFEEHQRFFSSQLVLVQRLDLEFGRKPGFVLIDEIQRKENAGLFLKGIYDRKLPYKLIVSGSGSLELREKIHESLAGRKKQFELASCISPIPLNRVPSGPGILTTGTMVRTIMFQFGFSLNGMTGLEVEIEKRAVSEISAAIQIELERNADQVGDWILYLFGQF